MSSSYWCGHKILDPQDMERQFSTEDSLAHLDCTGSEYMSESRTSQLAEDRAVLDSIPPREADFVELYFFKRVRQTAIADIFNVSQPTVCYRLQRAAARIKYLLGLPEHDLGEMRVELSKVLGDPVDVDVMIGMVETTCQSEVAKRMGVSQGFVRHRFLRTIAALEQMPGMDGYVAVFKHVSGNLNILREVQRAKWSEPVIYLVT